MFSRKDNPETFQKEVIDLYIFYLTKMPHVPPNYFSELKRALERMLKIIKDFSMFKVCMDIQIYLNIWFGGFITQNTLLGKLLHYKFFYVFHETLDKFFVFTQPHVTTPQEGMHVFMYTLSLAHSLKNMYVKNYYKGLN